MEASNKDHYLRNQVLVIVFLVSMLVILLISVSIHDAFGAQTIGITLSESCKRSTSCVSIEYLVDTFDNTNQFISGEFVYDDSGKMFRQKSPFEYHWNWYYHNHQTIIAVEPDAKWIPRLDTHIVVEPSSFVYFHPNDFKVKQLNKTSTYQYCLAWKNGQCVKSETGTVTEKGDFARVQRNNQYFDSCGFARTSSDAILDTINFILSGCKNPEHEKSLEVIIMPAIPLDYSQMKWYAYNQWLNEAKQNCKAKC